MTVNLLKGPCREIFDGFCKQIFITGPHMNTFDKLFCFYEDIREQYVFA